MFERLPLRRDILRKFRDMRPRSSTGFFLSIAIRAMPAIGSHLSAASRSMTWSVRLFSAPLGRPRPDVRVIAMVFWRILLRGIRLGGGRGGRSHSKRALNAEVLVCSHLTQARRTESANHHRHLLIAVSETVGDPCSCIRQQDTMICPGSAL